MESLKRRLSFRKKKDHVPECSKPHQWQEDERKVREGTCSFQVRYLGCIEVFESRGMQVCEEAVKQLKSNCRGKYQRAILYVSGDALRVVDEISKSMIVDQTIEKVSFCAPDRNHEKGFAYICRDGTTRRWMCHGFLAVKESGERLSHAVGCAFAICLERKQKREKETGVTVTFSQDRTSFTRTGSFRQTTLTERITDPQSALLAEPVPVRKVDNPFAVQRPHATENMLIRQGSFRGFSKLQEASSPFKRSVSLRLTDLPSTLKRQNAILESPHGINTNTNGAIEEVSPSQEEDSITQMCQQLTQGLSALNTDDPFAAAPPASHMPTSQHHTIPVSFQQQIPTIPPLGSEVMTRYPAGPVVQTNPWAPRISTAPVVSNDIASRTLTPTSTNPFLASPQGVDKSPLTNGTTGPQGSSPHHVTAPNIQHIRSHSIDSSDLSIRQPQHQQQRKQTLHEMSQHKSFQQNGNTSFNTSWASNSSSTSTSSTNYHQSNIRAQGPAVDPFDVAWAAKSVSARQQGNAVDSNPFAKSVKTFEVKL
ncbi:hypothetical protein ACJMK2_036077 [Sinanodonta woodiana]|uniref:PID domain-containing protein n=1 Tax=Sinanodonta woodiana TaxID=1069815 RepID=A0ABD3WG30_SINWO